MFSKDIETCNSWFSRSPSLEHVLFPRRHTHCEQGLNEGKKKQFPINDEIGESDQKAVFFFES
jgi:hypothetical protein